MTIRLNPDELALVQDALQISAAFKVYGDGRQEHQAIVNRLLARLKEGAK